LQGYREVLYCHFLLTLGRLQNSAQRPRHTRGIACLEEFNGKAFFFGELLEVGNLRGDYGNTIL
jgi:hypothetical protein